MSYPDVDEAVKEISERHGVPEEKVWEKIEDKIQPEAEDEGGRAKLGKILKMGGPWVWPLPSGSRLTRWRTPRLTRTGR